MRSTILLLAGFFIISLVSNAQESTKYFRYFEVKLEQSVELVNTSRSNSLAETPFTIQNSCTERHSIVIAVPADYPERVPQIKEDIKNALKKDIASRNILSLNSVKALDLESFCQ